MRMQRDGPNAGTQQPIPAPVCNETYNKQMGEVDRLDQLRASKKGFGSVELNRRRTKWTDKFDGVMFDLGNTIASTVHSAMHNGSPQHIDHKEFLWQVHEDWLVAAKWYSARRSMPQRQAAAHAAEAMVSPHSPPRPRRPPSTSPGLHLECIPIYPQRTNKRDGTETVHHDLGPCVACKLAGKPQKKTSFGCLACDPPVFLHAGDCFHRYHRKLADGSWQAPKQRKRRKGTEKDAATNKRHQASSARN